MELGHAPVLAEEAYPDARPAPPASFHVDGTARRRWGHRRGSWRQPGRRRPRFADVDPAAIARVGRASPGSATWLVLADRAKLPGSHDRGTRRPGPGRRRHPPDLGLSSFQLADAARAGFSFRRPRPADMRSTRAIGRPAGGPVGGARSSAELGDLLPAVRRGSLYAAHRPSGRARRRAEPPVMTADGFRPLVEQVLSCAGPAGREGSILPAELEGASDRGQRRASRRRWPASPRRSRFRPGVRVWSLAHHSRSTRTVLVKRSSGPSAKRLHVPDELPRLCLRPDPLPPPRRPWAGGALRGRRSLRIPAPGAPGSTAGRLAA